MRKVKQQVSLKEWHDRIYARQASGLTVACWCEANGVSVHAYYYWLRKLREDALLPQSNSPASEEFPTFCELTVSPEKPLLEKQLLQEPAKLASPDLCHASVSLQLPGLTLEISPTSTMQALRVARAVLESLCC